MATPQLARRLDQHSRRSGLAVGLSMGLAIGLCIASFVWFFLALEPIAHDFVNEAAAPPPVSAASAPVSTTSKSTKKATKKPTATPAKGSDASAFKMTHRTVAATRVNLRPSPSIVNNPVAVLDGSTPLQFLGEQQNGDDGMVWYKFRTQAGAEGWLREGAFTVS